MKSPNSSGSAYPTVSGTLMVVAPHCTATSSTCARNSGSERLASMALNSRSASGCVATRSRPRASPWTRVSASTSAGVFLIWYFMCTALVLMKVWMRGTSATFTASQQTRMSFSMARARPAMRGPLTSVAIALTASKSSGEAIGNPASMMSTRSLASWCATSSFSALFRVAPGACSPSRSVVSKILMCLVSLTSHTPPRGMRRQLMELRIRV